ncbi:MAG TPA: HYR domain-containing protein, partial [Gemmataceae bacterium]|nr:HYR domain-containing protein [Gemmataceae bacterium]
MRLQFVERLALLSMASMAFLATALWTPADAAVICATTNYLVGAPIPDNNINGLASTKTFSSTIGIVSDLNVTFKTTGGYNGDLFVYLVHDSGFSVLLNRVGRTSTDPFGYGDAGFNMTFDDQAASDVHLYRFALFGNNTTPLGGALTNSWMPDGRAADPFTVVDTDTRTELLSSFNGLNPNGSWTLFAADLSAVDAATLDSWGLEVCGDLPLPASVGTQPLGQIIECSSNVTFTVTTAGTGPFTNQWYKNDVAIPGATNLSLTINGAHPADGGTYTFVTCNMANCATSSPAVLHVRDTIAPAITTCAANVTNSANASCVAAVPSLVGQVVATDACGSVIVTQNPTAGTLLGLGTYTVTLSATDPSNNVTTCAATFAVRDTTPPSITCPAPIVITTPAGQLTTNATFTTTTADNCTASPTLICTPASGTAFNVGVTTVNCLSTDTAGNSNFCSFTITVQVPPLITVQPQTQRTPMGNGAVFGVTAVGSTPLVYFWFSNNVAVANANASSLAVSNVTLANNGDSYRVVASNAFGLANSAAATLVVTPISAVSFDFNT